MADYALGLNATGARVSSGDCKLQCEAELESDGSGFNWVDVCDVQLCSDLSLFQRDWMVQIVEEKQKSNVT